MIDEKVSYFIGDPDGDPETWVKAPMSLIKSRARAIYRFGERDGELSFDDGAWFFKPTWFRLLKVRLFS